MLDIRSSADMARALADHIDPGLKRLLGLRQTQLIEGNNLDLRELGQFVIAEPGDTLRDIEGVAGVQLTATAGDLDFSPGFEFVEDHGSWFEAVTIMSDDGYGVALFVPDQPDIDPALLELMRSHT